MSFEDYIREMKELIYSAEEAADGADRIARAVERIRLMEGAFDKATGLLPDKAGSEIEQSINEQELEALVSVLDAYYTSQAWKNDFAMDEEGLLPGDLKRGVLSEDGICNLLEKYKELAKLAVVFPGLGYHTDKPLLYYSKKLAKQHGFKIIEVGYKIPWTIPEVKNNPDKMGEATGLFVSQVREQLSNIHFGDYSKVLFIGKSIGTTIAAKIDKDLKVGAYHLAFTPVPPTFDYLKGKRSIVFHGLSDPWCDNEVVDTAKGKLKFKCELYPDANHSLETGDVNRDTEIICDVMKKVEKLLSEGI